MFKQEALETQEAEGGFPALTACAEPSAHSRGTQVDLKGMESFPLRQ